MKLFQQCWVLLMSELLIACQVTKSPISIPTFNRTPLTLTLSDLLSELVVAVTQKTAIVADAADGEPPRRT